MADSANLLLMLTFNKDALTRSTTALAAIRRLDNPNIAALSVALRTLRSVIRSGAAT